MPGMKPCFLLFASLVAICGLTACTGPDSNIQTARTQFGESVVLAGEQPANLACLPRRNPPLTLRSTYLKDLPETVHYHEGVDYVVEYETGQIRRTPGSRIPDFQTNMLYGVEDFDHGQFPRFGNGGYFVFVDYAFRGKPDWPKQAPQTDLLPRTLTKLKRGESLRIVAFGDSITAGGDATRPELIFWKRWADELQRKYPAATIEAINGATGGDTTRNGLDRLTEKVLKEKPDLVLVGFGMNDHNKGGFGTPVEVFAQNLETMIDRIRKESGAEIILLSTFPPNPKWRYGSHNMPAYADATEAVARRKQCAYVDIYGNWVALASRKKPEDLLGNNINHPNDFGHWMYFAVLQRLGL